LAGSRKPADIKKIAPMVDALIGAMKQNKLLVQSENFFGFLFFPRGFRHITEIRVSKGGTSVKILEHYFLPDW
jgi:hypothetical protein